MNNRQSIALALVLGLSALALAAALRHQLIEPVHLTTYCDGGAASGWCTLRAWVIQAFVHQRIGWFSLGIAVLSSITNWRPLAALAIVSSCSGMVLYTADLCAIALVLSALVFVRDSPADGQAVAPANINNNAQ
jgi:small-conductance mechanosensitive channel